MGITYEQIEDLIRDANARSTGALARQDGDWHAFRLLAEPKQNVYLVRAPIGDAPIIVAYIDGVEIDFDELDLVSSTDEYVTFAVDQHTDRITIRRPDAPWMKQDGLEIELTVEPAP